MQVLRLSRDRANYGAEKADLGFAQDDDSWVLQRRKVRAGKMPTRTVDDHPANKVRARPALRSGFAKVRVFGYRLHLLHTRLVFLLQWQAPIFCGGVAGAYPAETGEKRSDDAGDGGGTTQLARATDAHDFCRGAQDERHRAGKNAAGAGDPSADAALERFVHNRIALGFQFEAFIGFRGSREQADAVECGRGIVAEKFEYGDTSIDARHSEVKWKCANVKIPDRNHGCADENASVVGEGQTE